MSHSPTTTAFPKPIGWRKRRATLTSGRSPGWKARIRSEKLGDPKWRTVSNVGFEGIGFMTANMFYRRDLLRRVEGFDERFHDFREDTDLAWRVMEFGEIPHARDVVVFHPPHPATVERESQVERAKMFRLDPLLLERHPDKYIQLLAWKAIIATSRDSGITSRAGLQESGVDAPVGKLFQLLRVHDPEWWAQVTNNDGQADWRRLLRILPPYSRCSRLIPQPLHDSRSRMHRPVRRDSRKREPSQQSAKSERTYTRVVMDVKS